MAQYRCLVAQPDGKTAWRQIEATDPAAAASLASADGSFALDVRSGTPTFVERLNQPIGLSTRLGLSDLALLMRQLSLLIGASLPVDRSLDLLREQATKVRQRQLLAEMLTRVREGTGLGAAMEASGAFPAYAIGVIRSAEKAGKLGPALRALADQLNRADAARREIVTALAYPAVVLLATLASLAIVLTSIVPQFEPIFEGQEAQLPAITQFVLALSRGVRSDAPLLLALAVAILLFGWLMIRGGHIAALPERWRRAIPGAALRDQFVAAQLAGLLALLLESGIRVAPALPLVRNATASSRWRAYLDQAEARVREGSRVSSALASGSALLPLAALRLVEVGERSGKLSETLRRASEIMGEAASVRLQRIISLANPIAIMTLGAIVAILVGGVMLGIFALGDFAG